MSHINPTELTIACFGGVRKMARALGVDPSAVIRWRRTGLIPSGYQKRVLEAAWQTGSDITAHELVFGRDAWSS